MCIRDRVEIDPKTGKMRLSRKALLPKPEGYVEPAERPERGDRNDRGCLLYTSDAADERSSVDLGGRRIIKKKKHRNIGGGDHTRTT